MIHALWRPMTALTLVLSLAALPALAQPASPVTTAAGATTPGTPPPPARAFMRRFEAANTTHDGKLTRAQAQAGGMNWMVNHFQQVDSGSKGFITLSDIQAYRQSMAAGTPAKRPAPAAAAAGDGTQQQASRHPMIDRFNAANTSHDGQLTITQAGAARMRWVVDHFAAIDGSSKGYVTIADIRAYRRQNPGQGPAAAPPAVQ